VYKPIVDVFVYVMGGLDENEIMLGTVLSSFVESLTILLKYSTIHQKSVRETHAVGSFGYRVAHLG
jgi:hypothetical protein